ncbi:MAG: DUF4041 domain-containing protein [Fusobacteriaceae bacterium]
MQAGIIVFIVVVAIIFYLVTNFYMYIIAGALLLFLLIFISRKKEFIYKKKTDLEAEVLEVEERMKELNRTIREVSTREKVASDIKSLVKLLEKKEITLAGQEKRLKFLKEELSELEKTDFIKYSGSYVGDEYDFDNSNLYKEELKKLKEEQKEMIKKDNIIIGIAVRFFDKKSVKDLSKLVVRGFNGECDSVYSNVKHSNLKSSEDKILKIYTVINRLCQSSNFKISPQFLELKIRELLLIQGYKEAKNKEIEDQKIIREQIMEEEKTRREYEKKIKETETEERRYQKALEQAQKEYDNIMGTKSEEERLKYDKRISELEKQLEESQQLKERAISQAQLTKAGYVYIISNIGSFGENVYKIGMTRRLEPLDRVKELGNASVPFPFDVHAMIYSENAPNLERKLHKEFNEKSLNLVNFRKEFFKVNLDEVEKFVLKNHGEFKLIKFSEAEQFRKTLEMRENHKIPKYSIENEFIDIEELSIN